MNYSKNISLFLFTSLFTFQVFSQSDNCVVGSTQVLTPGAAGAACTPTAANTNAGFTDSNQGCIAGTEDDDGWFSFVATATSHTVTVDGALNMDAVLGVYTNCTSTLATGGTCIDATLDDGIETRTITGLTIGNTYYICVHDYYAGGGDFTICVTTPAAPPANDGCGSPTGLTPGALGAACSPTAGSSLSATLSGQGCVTGNEDDDVWYSFVATATSHVVTVDGAANMDAVLGVYSTCAGAQPAGGACVDATAGNGNETVTVTGLTIGNTYLICIYDYAAGGGDFTVCVTTPYPTVNMSNTTTTTCGVTFLDNGGTGNYTSNQNLVHTFCPSTAGQCISVTFSAFDTEDGFDGIYIYDGNSMIYNQFYDSPYTGITAPGPFTATTSNASGCITFNFTSDGSFNYSGFTATITCATCAAPPAPTAQDCGALQTVCSDQAFAGNSSGSGNYNGELNLTNRGCLYGENQSSWYSFTATTGGTIALNITPSNGTDDYDFAIWGPLASVTCPPVGPPLRCSWSNNPGNTGLQAGAGDQTENDLGDSFVDPIVAATNDNYVLLVDNYTGSAQPFTLDWTLTGGATLGCVPLPIELTTFEGNQENDYIRLKWITFSENNNDYFTVEKSQDAINFESIAIVDGGGTTTQMINYTYLDKQPSAGINYYRIRQTDFDGKSVYSDIISVNFISSQSLVNNIHPNPTNSMINFDFFTAVKGEVHIQIMDYTGRIVSDRTQTVNEGKTFLSTQMEELASGIYTLKVSFGKTGYTSASKIIKK